MSKRAAAKKAIKTLWNIDPNLSEDDNLPLEVDENVMQDDEDNVAGGVIDEAGDEEESTDEEDFTADIDQGNLTSSDGTVWNKVNNNQAIPCAGGRFPARNVFSATPGVSSFARRKIKDTVSAWRVLINDKILNTIVKYTNQKAKSIKNSWKDITVSELEVFIGLFLLHIIFSLFNYCNL